MKAFHHFNHIVQVYSKSWDPFDDGFTIQKPSILFAAALEEGVQSVSIINFDTCVVIQLPAHYYTLSYM